MTLASQLQRVHRSFVERVQALQRAPHNMTAADARDDAMRRLGALHSSGKQFGMTKVMGMLNDGSLWVPK